MRYDDTNPETEDERYIREIQEMVEWLGKRDERSKGGRRGDRGRESEGERDRVSEGKRGWSVNSSH